MKNITAFPSGHNFLLQTVWFDLLQTVWYGSVLVTNRIRSLETNFITGLIVKSLVIIEYAKSEKHIKNRSGRLSSVEVVQNDRFPVGGTSPGGPWAAGSFPVNSPSTRHPENASNAFRPHYVEEIWKRNNQRPFWICAWVKHGQGNHMIIMTRRVYEKLHAKTKQPAFTNSAGLKRVFETD